MHEPQPCAKVCNRVNVLYKTVIFLVAEQSLLLMKVFIQFTMPGEADWVEELAARNVHIW